MKLNLLRFPSIEWKLILLLKRAKPQNSGQRQLVCSEKKPSTAAPFVKCRWSVMLEKTSMGFGSEAIFRKGRGFSPAQRRSPTQQQQCRVHLSHGRRSECRQCQIVPSETGAHLHEPCLSLWGRSVPSNLLWPL